MNNISNFIRVDCQRIIFENLKNCGFGVKISEGNTFGRVSQICGIDLLCLTCCVLDVCSKSQKKLLVVGFWLWLTLLVYFQH